MSTSNATPDTKPNVTTGALDGVRVLDFSALIAGPSAARGLADHGAEVIKLERFPDGDAGRIANRKGAARSPLYIQHNGGKKSICVDLTRPEGLGIARNLARCTDVVVEAFTPGVMRKLGLGYDELRALNPRIILCSISGFGQTGPNSQRPGYAHIAHSMTGWLALQSQYRDPPEPPRGPGIAIADVVAGITAFGAICAALFKRERTGRGDWIDIALFDALFAANEESTQRCLINGTVSPVYHAVHRTTDGYVTANLGPDFRAWQSICRAMGRLDLLTDPRFTSLQAVQRHHAESQAIFAAWLATLSCAEAEQTLSDHHVAVGIVMSLEQAIRQPQVVARRMTVAVNDPVLGRIDMINSPAKFADARVEVRGPAPTLGEHNVDVLRDILGMDESHIAALAASGVLRSEST